MKKLSWLDDEQKIKNSSSSLQGPDSICCQPKEERNRCTSTLLIRNSFEILFVCCFFLGHLNHTNLRLGKKITTEAMLNIVEQKRWRILQLWDARFMAWLSMGGKVWWILSRLWGCLWFDLNVNCSWTVCFETSKEHWPSVWYERWIFESCDLATSVRQTPWCNLRLLGTSHAWKSLRLNWKLALPAASVWFCTQIFATSRRKAQPVNVNSLKSYTYLSPVLAFSISRRVLD